MQSTTVTVFHQGSFDHRKLFLPLLEQVSLVNYRKLRLGSVYNILTKYNGFRHRM